jgi:transcriptional regulator with XRE-family HTH domain
MDLNKKIGQVISDSGMSPTAFADKIGVQRSSISHILSGRNKPSLDIIQKVLITFPDIDPNWLIFDNENEPETPIARRNTPYIPPVMNKREEVQATLDMSSNFQKRDTVNTIRPIEKAAAVMQQPSFEAKKVERIVTFYTDGTFRESKPE